MRIINFFTIFFILIPLKLWAQSSSLCLDVAKTRENLQKIASLSLHLDEEYRMAIFNEIIQHSPINITTEIEKKFFLSMVYALAPYRSLTAEEAQGLNETVVSHDGLQAFSMLSTFVVRPIVRRGVVATAARLTQIRLIRFLRSIAAPTIASGLTLGGVFVLENLIYPSHVGLDSVERMGEQFDQNIALTFMLPTNEACDVLSIWGPAYRKFYQINVISEYALELIERKIGDK